MISFSLKFMTVDSQSCTFEAGVNDKGKGFILKLPPQQVTLEYSDAATFANALSDLVNSNSQQKVAQARGKSKTETKRVSKK
jgi:hypothetical protein